MCWSLEVTLAFAAAETLALLALVGRARRYEPRGGSLVPHHSEFSFGRIFGKNLQ